MEAAVQPVAATGRGASPEAKAISLPSASALLARNVAEGGGDLSGGERQLLCLARALLHCRHGGARLVVLDEATSVMSHECDLAIQDVVRTQLAGRSILVVAHRLRSVIDADAVCVMDQGCCAEYGAPHCLLQRSDSAFARLVATSGEETELRAMAAMRPAVWLPKDQLG